MKNLLLILVVISSLIFVGCGGCATPVGSYGAQPYSYVQGPGGAQMVACTGDNGMSFLMDLAMFNMLMNSGGYGAVMNQYHSYPSRFGRYAPGPGWRSYNGPTYSADRYNGFRRTGAAPPTFTQRGVPTVKPTFGRGTTPTRSFGNPARSSPTRSFSTRSSGFGRRR